MLMGWMLPLLSCQSAARATHLWLDEVSLVQLSSSSAGEFQQDFRLEDAEPLFRAAYEAVHNGSNPTLEEKAISLLQRLAQHRRVVGTSAQKALLKAASEAQQMFDSGRFEAAAELELEQGLNSSSEEEEESVARSRPNPGSGGTWNPLSRISMPSMPKGPFDDHWNPFHDVNLNDWKEYQWVHITTPVINKEGMPVINKDGDTEVHETGYCWTKNSGKPLACEVNARNTHGRIGVDFAKTWQKKNYANPCEQLCGRKSWCSGYGWIEATGKCILFNDGSYECERGSWYTMDGVEPIQSAEDLELVVGATGDATTEFRKRSDIAKVRYSRIGEYKCVAKYAQPQKKNWLFGSDVFFTQIDDGATCQHVTSEPRAPVYLPECTVQPDQLAFIDDITGFSNPCEKLCASLRWCTGYAYRKPTFLPGYVYTMEECALYSKYDEGCPMNPDGWYHSTKILPKTFRLPANQIKAPHSAGLLSGHFIADEETRLEGGWLCKAKGYEGKLRTKAGAGPMCGGAKGGALFGLALAITSAVGMVGCPDIADSGERASLSGGGGGVFSLNASIPTSVAPPNLTELAALRADDVAAENFTEAQARGAVARYASQGTEADAKAIRALQAAKLSGDGLCYLQQSGQALRFLSYALGSWFGSGPYHCTLLNKAKHFCTSTALKAVGAGLFGAGLYGGPRIAQECSNNPWPVTSLMCSMDFTKASMYLGRAIWKFIQLVWLSEDASFTEKGLGITDMVASLTFIAEGILRTQGPCGGQLSGDPANTKMENGGCIATYLEVSALGLQSLAYGGSAVRYCTQNARAGSR